MSGRWWAPRRASLTPDAVVLALLQPDGERDGDLGATVLAAHRAGAAACEHVAKAGLPSQASLITALAGVRATLADPMVTSISKSMDPSYAGLLVRDVFDDAEDGAVSLFATCVSKGVSPPLAASRVGAVFGVPSAALGKYQTLAADPKANPAALTDAADRALMGYVAKLVASEGTEQVAKAAPTTFKDDDFNPRLHPRGGGGRFVATEDKPSILQPHILAQLRGLGVGGQAAPQVGPKTRVTRKTRRTRKTVKPEEQGSIRSRSRSLSGSPSARLSPRQLTYAKVLVAANPRRLDPVYDEGTRNLPPLLSLPDKDAAKYGDASYHELSYPVAFSVAGREDNDFHHRLRLSTGEQKDPGQAAFRIGHLLQAAGDPEIHLARSGLRPANPDQRLIKSDIDLQVDSKAEISIDRVSEKGGYVPPDVRFIHPQDMLPGQSTHSLQEVEDWKESERLSNFSGTRTTASGREEEWRDDAEDEFTFVLPQYIPLGPDASEDDYAAMAVVQYQPADPRNPGVRPAPQVTEYVFGDSAIGTEDGSGRDASKVLFTLDPNTAYKIVPGGGLEYATYEGGKVAPVRMWDDKRKVVVNRYWLRAIDESEVAEIVGVDKALTAFDEKIHPRDSFGQWVNAQLAAPREAEPAPQARVSAGPLVRRTRKTRRTRQTRQVSEQMAELAVGTPATRMLTGQRRAAVAQASLGRSIKAGLADIPPKDGLKSLSMLSDLSVYKLLLDDAGETERAENGSFSYVREAIDDEQFADLISTGAGAWLTLNSVAMDRILEAKNMKPEELGSKMNFNVEADLDERFGSSFIQRALGSIDYNPNVSESQFSDGLTDIKAGLILDHDRIRAKMVEIFEQNPDVDVVEMGRKGNKLIFYGNDTPTKTQNLIEIDPGLNPDKPAVLEYKGEYRAHNVRYSTYNAVREEIDNLAHISFGDGEQHVSDPKLHIFKVTNPVVRHYSVGND